MRTRKNMVLVAVLLLSMMGCTMNHPPADTVPTATTEPTVAETTEATVPTETTVPVTEPEETTSATEPMVTEPEETEPEVTEPKEDPKPTDPPKPTEPKDDPKPTDPLKPTEPKDDPKPTDPPKTHTHSYKAKVVEPTCEEKGYTKHTCSCGDSYTDSYTDALGHDMVDEVHEPGPGYEGYTLHSCSRCDYSYMDNYTDALPEPTPAEVQKAIIKYINKYRADQGSTQLTYLPGMTDVAKYRSKQLVKNFAHDGHDIKEAYNHFQYGELVDMTDMGFDESFNYYEAQTNEAICKGFGVWGTSDEVGRVLADALRNSSGHWRYVGSSEYSYTGVGVTYDGSTWFVCVIVGRVNYG